MGMIGSNPGYYEMLDEMRDVVEVECECPPAPFGEHELCDDPDHGDDPRHCKWCGGGIEG